MSTYRELISITNDLVKNLSDDATYTEEHTAFLLNKYRLNLLKQKYNKGMLSVPQSNMQTVCVNMVEVNSIPGCSAEGCLDDVYVRYFRSATSIPYTLDSYDADITIAKVPLTSYYLKVIDPITEETMEIVNRIIGNDTLKKVDLGIKGKTIYSTTCNIEAADMFNLLSNKYKIRINKEGTASSCAAEKTAALNSYGNVNVVSKYRIGYTGFSKYTRKLAYAAFGDDNYLYLKTSNKDFDGYNRAFVTGIFEDVEKAYELSECNDTLCESGNNGSCDVWDNRFPMEEALTTNLLALTVKELLGASWRPRARSNDANDDLAEIAAFVRRNLRTNVQKQMSGDELE